MQALQASEVQAKRSQYMKLGVSQGERVRIQAPDGM